MKLPAPTSDVQASIAAARAGSDELYKALTTWPSWFFARGDLAAGGAGDESPLVFDDTTLNAERTHHFTIRWAARRPRPRGAGAGRTDRGIPHVRGCQPDDWRDAGGRMAQVKVVTRAPRRRRTRCTGTAAAPQRPDGVAAQDRCCPHNRCARS